MRKKETEAEAPKKVSAKKPATTRKKKVESEPVVEAPKKRTRKKAAEPIVETKVEPSKPIKKKKIKSKPASKTIVATIKGFFKDVEKVRPICNYSLGKKSVLRVLEIHENEVFLNLDDNHYLYNKETQTVHDFGDIFKSEIHSKEDIPWST